MTAGVTVVRDIPIRLSRRRRAIARSMTQSLSRAAQLTTVAEAGFDEVFAACAACRPAYAEVGLRLSPLTFVALVAARVVLDHPPVNGSLDDDGELATFHSTVNLGIAVDTPAGLVVPNLKGAERLTLPQLAEQISDVAARAPLGKLRLDEVTGGTFTITNTGSRGSLLDTPILNPPESAILALGAIERRPFVDDGGAVAVRLAGYLCLTYDHRLIDGADAAGFLGDLKAALIGGDWVELARAQLAEHQVGLTV